MWTYNMSYLAHANHKYIDRYMGPSGKYIYVYDHAVRVMGKIPKVVSNAQRRVKDYIDNRYYVQKGTDAFGNKTYKLTDKDSTDGYLGDKTFEEQQEIQRKEKYRDILLEQLKTSDKVAAERRRASITDPSRAREREQSRSVEVTRAMQQRQQQEKAAKQAESEHRRTTNVADSQNARQAAINKSILKNRQLEAAKQQEAERKAASRQFNTQNAQNARQAAINKSVFINKQLEAAKQQEAERKAASRQFNTQNAQEARAKGVNESVRKTWEQKSKEQIKNRAQFDKAQDELVRLCTNFDKQWDAANEYRSNKKFIEQRAFAVKNWATEIKNIASLLAASNVSVMDKNTYNHLQGALQRIRAFQNDNLYDRAADVGYYSGRTEDKNDETARKQLYYEKNGDLVKIIEDIINEDVLNEKILKERR